jgi:hypothetical protein
MFPTFYRTQKFILMFVRVSHSILIQMNSVHILTHYFFNINFNIFLLFSLRSLQVFWLKFCMLFSSPHSGYMTSPSPWFHHPINIWWRKQVMKLFLMQFSPSFNYFLCLLGPNIFLSTLFINTTNSHSSFQITIKFHNAHTRTHTCTLFNF